MKEQPRVAFRWPPAEEGSLDVLDLVSTEPEPGTANRPAASAGPGVPDLDAFDDEAPDLDQPQVADWDAAEPVWPPRDGPLPVRREADPLATVGDVPRRVVTSVRHWRRERVALVALALLAAAQSAFIGFRMISHDRAGTSGRAQPTERAAVSGTAGHRAVNVPSSVDAASASSAPVGGTLVVTTVPAGGEVSIDGESRGTAPVSVPDLAPGDHAVMVRSRRGAVRQQVRVEGGQQTALVVPLGAAPSTAPGASAARGWISVTTPLAVRVLEGEQVVGTSEMQRIELGPGRHTLAFVNDAAGFTTTQSVVITPGKSTTVQLDVPKQHVAINATPWAEVWIDGARAGETPIGNMKLSPGPHVVRFHHPDLGDRTVRTTVRADESARISVDMRKQ